MAVPMSLFHSHESLIFDGLFASSLRFFTFPPSLVIQLTNVIAVFFNSLQFCDELLFRRYRGLQFQFLKSEVVKIVTNFLYQYIIKKLLRH